MLLYSITKAQKTLTQNFRTQRLNQGLTQAGLSKRSGVPLPTLRKFEQSGLISLESFLKLAMSLGMLEKIVKATETHPSKYDSIAEIIKAEQQADRKKKIRNRGWRS